MTSVAFVSVTGLSVRYPVRGWNTGEGPARLAVDNVSFEIQRGETYALVGESGCGKTTTARAILRLVTPLTGEINVNGIDVRALHGDALRRHRRRMQVVFQDPYTSLNPRMSVGDAVAEGLLVHDLARGRDASEQARTLLTEVGLDADDAVRFPHELSGGQRQRVAIARALAVGPDLLVLDEAVSALDVTTQARILDLFERIRVARHLTCLFIAHNLAVVQRVASTVAVMQAGRIVEQGPVARVFASPEHGYTKALLAAMPGRGAKAAAVG